MAYTIVKTPVCGLCCYEEFTVCITAEALQIDKENGLPSELLRAIRDQGSSVKLVNLLPSTIDLSEIRNYFHEFPVQVVELTGQVPITQENVPVLITNDDKYLSAFRSFIRASGFDYGYAVHVGKPSSFRKIGIDPEDEIDLFDRSDLNFIFRLINSLKR